MAEKSSSFVIILSSGRRSTRLMSCLTSRSI